MTNITVKDIQPTKSKGESHDDLVRKAWVLQMSDDTKALFKKYPLAVRIQLYKSFDKEVFSIWMEKLETHRLDAIDKGAKMVKIGDDYRLEDKFCVDVNEVLIAAALEWNESFKASTVAIKA